MVQGNNKSPSLRTQPNRTGILNSRPLLPWTAFSISWIVSPSFQPWPCPSPVVVVGQVDDDSGQSGHHRVHRGADASHRHSNHDRRYRGTLSVIWKILRIVKDCNKSESRFHRWVAPEDGIYSPQTLDDCDPARCNSPDRSLLLHRDRLRHQGIV